MRLVKCQRRAQVEGIRVVRNEFETAVGCEVTAGEKAGQVTKATWLSYTRAARRLPTMRCHETKANGRIGHIPKREDHVTVI